MTTTLVPTIAPFYWFDCECLTSWVWPTFHDDGDDTIDSRVIGMVVDLLAIAQRKPQPGWKSPTNGCLISDNGMERNQLNEAERESTRTRGTSSQTTQTEWGNKNVKGTTKWR